MLKGVNKLFEALKVVSSLYYTHPVLYIIITKVCSSHCHAHLQHPYLHPFERMDFDYDTRQVVIVQPYIQTGSLKDAIYGVCRHVYTDSSYIPPGIHKVRRSRSGVKILWLIYSIHHSSTHNYTHVRMIILIPQLYRLGPTRIGHGNTLAERKDCQQRKFVAMDDRYLR